MVAATEADVVETCSSEQLVTVTVASELVVPVELVEVLSGMLILILILMLMSMLIELEPVIAAALNGEKSALN